VECTPEERFRRFLHDEVCQYLSAAGLQLDLLRMDFGRHAPDGLARIDNVQHLLEEAISRVRDYCRNQEAAPDSELDGFYAR